jgi:hypothetical protein
LYLYCSRHLKKHAHGPPASNRFDLSATDLLATTNTQIDEIDTHKEHELAVEKPGDASRMSEPLRIQNQLLHGRPLQEGL